MTLLHSTHNSADSTTARGAEAAADAGLAYLRHPDVQGEHLVFIAANDVWIAPLTGGDAHRLTNEGAPVDYPRFSPDGQWVAFTSKATGAPEVWVVKADGSTDPQRLTSWGRRLTRTVGWLDNEHVIASSPEGAGLRRDVVLWSLPLPFQSTSTTDTANTASTASTASTAPEILPLGRSEEVAFHPDGTTVVTTPYGRRPPAWWKHYQGGTAAKLWISRENIDLNAPREQHENRSWEPLIDDIREGKAGAFFYGDRLVFASDTPGSGSARTDRASGNLWSVNRDGTDLTRHTSFTSDQGYLRDPASDGATIVFASRGRLYSMTALDAEPQEIEIRTAGVGAARRPFLAKPSDNLIAVRPTHNARSSLVEWRGSAHVLTHKGGPSRLLAAGPGVRIREVTPLGSTEYTVYVTDEKAAHDRTEGGVGSDQLGLARLDGTGSRTLLDVGDVGRILHLAPAPDGTKVAFSTHDNRVFLARLDGVSTGSSDDAVGQKEPTVTEVTELTRSTGGEVRTLAFSPDSRFLAFSVPNSWLLSRIQIVDTHEAQPEVIDVTSGKFHDMQPVFSRCGKFLALISLRTFETRYDDMVFDLGFVNAARPFLIPLERTTADPFGPLPDGWGPGETEEAKKAAEAQGKDEEKTGDNTADKAPKTTIDLQDLESRIVPFPVTSGAFTDLMAVKDGFVWRRIPASGELGSERAGVEGEAPGPALEFWSLKDRTLTVLAENVKAATASGDGESLVIREGSEWVCIPAGRKAEKEDPARIVIDTSRLSLRVDPVAERRGMLWDNYRIMAQQYWRADMDGQDWHAMTSWYDPVVSRLVTTDDFVDMMWEVVGELGTSHAYVMPAPASQPRELPAAHLGIEVKADGDRVVIARILHGDSSDPDARSPLLAPGVAANEGDAIVSVGGHLVQVQGESSLAELLQGRAGKPTELVLSREGAERRVVVTPLADDAQLSYQDWVASRREFVRERSGGRLGYLHIPDMVSSGWAQMHRDLREAVSKEGMVVDVRYNNGGHTSQLVTDRLARRVLSWTYPRGEEPTTYPAFAPRGPIVLVTNQEAGSDGDIVNAVSKAMKIGPIVGTRTWGGVIGIDGRYNLVDGTSVTEPKYASWYEGVEWSIENYGVDPDIEVPFPPNAYVAGEDPQLARGVDEALALIERHPAAVPPEIPAPRF